MKEVKKRVKSSKAINEEEEEGSDEEVIITKINKIRWDTRTKQYFIIVTFSDGTVAENTKDAVIEDFKALDCTTVLEDYIKEHKTDFDKPPPKNNGIKTQQSSNTAKNMPLES
eukprot:11292845-Ditylum_brightwellii.AAC.1